MGDVYEHNPIVCPTVHVEEIAGGWKVWYTVPRPDKEHPLKLYGKIFKREILDNAADWGERTFEVMLAHTIKIIMAKVVWIQMHDPELGSDGEPVDAAPRSDSKVRSVLHSRGH